MKCDTIRKKMNKTAEVPVSITDAYSNTLFRLGAFSQAPTEATEHPLTRTTENYALMDSLYRGSWLVQNIIDSVPDDMLREWADIEGIDADEAVHIQTAVRRSGIRSAIGRGLKWGRLYGGAVGLILVDGQSDLSLPLSLSNIPRGAFRGLYILDRWTGVQAGSELIDDINSRDFGLPAYYTVRIGRDIVPVHHSRVVRFIGRELPYIEAVAAQFWGESEVEAVYGDLINHENTVANMANLVFQANLHTMEVENLEQLFAMSAPEMQRRFWATMQAQNVLRSNFGLQLVDKGSKITNEQYSFAGLSDVYDAMCQNISGASHIPMTKLFGRSPGGLNSTGESDMRNYYDYIDSLRESRLRPALEKVLPVLMMSELGYVPDDFSVSFPPLWKPTEAERSEIDNRDTQTVIAAFQAGLIDLAGAKDALRRSGLFSSISAEEVEAAKGQTYQDVTALRDPMAGLGGEEAVPFE